MCLGPQPCAGSLQGLRVSAARSFDEVFKAAGRAWPL